MQQYVITDGIKFIKENSSGDPTKVNGIALATIYEDLKEANTYFQSTKMKNLISGAKSKFRIEPVEGEMFNRSTKAEKEIEEEIFQEIKEMDGVYEDFNDVKFSDNVNKHVYAGKTFMEDEEFDLAEFLSTAVRVFSQLDKYAENMAYMEREMDLAINDMRHFNRDEKTKLNAIQMQSFGYCVQEMERMRKKYKTNKILASIFTKDIKRLKNKSFVKVINNITESEYKYRRLDMETIANMIKTRNVHSNLKVVS